MDHSPAFLALVDAARARIREIDAGDLPQRMADCPDLVLIDTREDHEWQAGHVLGAVHMGKGVIERDIEKRYPERYTPLYLYCGGGYRSALAADNLRQMGYTDVWSVDGGYKALQAMLPVTKAQG